MLDAGDPAQKYYSAPLESASGTATEIVQIEAHALAGYHFDHWEGSGDCWTSATGDSPDWNVVENSHQRLDDPEPENRVRSKIIYIDMIKDGVVIDREITPVFEIGDWPVDVIARTQEDLDICEGALKAWSGCMQSDDDGVNDNADVLVCHGYYLDESCSFPNAEIAVANNKDVEDFFKRTDFQICFVDKIGPLKNYLTWYKSYEIFPAGVTNNLTHLNALVAKKSGFQENSLTDVPNLPVVFGHELGHADFEGIPDAQNPHTYVPESIYLPIFEEIFEQTGLSESWWDTFCSNLYSITWPTIPDAQMFGSGQNPKDNAMFFYAREGGSKIHEGQPVW